MEDLVDLIATNASPSEVSDSIKNILFTKASERVDAYRPQVASALFGEEEQSNEGEDEGEE
jgi:hypothetical protein